MKSSRVILNLMFVAIVALAVAVPTIAQDPQAQPSRVAVGRKQKISGVVISREADKMIVRDINGSDVAVTLSGATKITEKKSNPFRSAKNYPVTALLRGLEVEVEGRGDSSGVLVAEKIKFTNDDFGGNAVVIGRVPLDAVFTERPDEAARAECGPSAIGHLI